MLVNMNNMVQLSRYLYIIDEVILTFITSLLNKRTIEECLFWFSEFYYSGYEEDSWYLLGSIYKDYYAGSGNKTLFPLYLATDY